MTQNFTTSAKRAPLSPELEPILKTLAGLVPLLEEDPNWYGSIFFERKTNQNYVADLKKTNVQHQITQGVVLRIYDGYTLFEQATDDLALDSLQKNANELVKRVKKSKQGRSSQPNFYTPPNWKQRLDDDLDDEIKLQIPGDVSATSNVHFGVRYEEDPTAYTAERILNGLKDTIKRIQELAKQQGFMPKEITYLMVRQVLGKEESIFVDRETKLSQTLYRQGKIPLVMSGPERVVERVGGLGGMEVVDFPDSILVEMLEDLKGLKSAEKLAPGKYRVLFSPAISGVFAHEAFGHSQEGDTCVRGRSKAWDFYESGELAGNEHATILNNPSIFENADKTSGAWGSYFFDEEGWLAKEQVILDKGKLTSPMTNLTSAIRLKVPRTANGKRESWSHGVYTRQTNTYFSAGDKCFEDLISQVDDGFLATQTAGGMEDPKGMGIQVGIAYLKEVKAGKLTGKIFKGPQGGDIQMTGYTPEVLNCILDKSKIEVNSREKDTAKHPLNDVGGCGKYHKEFVQAGSGGPYLLMDGITLG